MFLLNEHTRANLKHGNMKTRGNILLVFFWHYDEHFWNMFLKCFFLKFSGIVPVPSVKDDRTIRHKAITLTWCCLGIQYLSVKLPSLFIVCPLYMCCCKNQKLNTCYVSICNLFEFQNASAAAKKKIVKVSCQLNSRTDTWINNSRVIRI